MLARYPWENTPDYVGTGTKGSVPSYTDPSNKIMMQPSAPQTPISMQTGGPGGTSDFPKGIQMQTGGLQIPVSMQTSQPQTPIQMSANPTQTNVQTAINQIPNYTAPQLSSQPANPLRAQIDKFLAENPGDEGRIARAFGISQGEVDAAMGGRNTLSPNPSVPNYTSSNNSGIPMHEQDWYKNADPRLKYGYNPAQWAINRRIEAAADRNEASGGGYGYGLNRQSWLATQPEYLANLPDEAEYNAFRAKQLEPYNQSVRSEVAAGRPTSTFTPLPNYDYSGGTGGTPRPGFDNLGRPIPNSAVNRIPNYTAPNNVTPPTMPQINPAEIQNNLVQQATNNIPANDRWQGTRRRTPSYV